MEALDRDIEGIEETLGGVMARGGFRARGRDLSVARCTCATPARPMTSNLQIPNGKLTPPTCFRNRTAFQRRDTRRFTAPARPTAKPASRSSRSASTPSADTPKPQLKRFAIEGSDASAARKGTRRAFFTGAEPRFPGRRDLRLRPLRPATAPRAGDHRDAVHHHRRARASGPRSTNTATSFCCT